MIPVRLMFAGLILAGASAFAQTVLQPPVNIPQISEPPMEYSQQGCPTDALSATIEPTPILPTDYIDFQVIVSFLPLGPFEIRVYGDGHVERQISYCPLHPEDRTIHLDPEVAQKLLARARDGGFGQLCSHYTLVEHPGHFVDGNSTSLTLSLHEQAKTVVNALGKPPDIYFELSKAIEEISPMWQFSYDRLTSERKAECDAFRARRFGTH